MKLIFIVFQFYSLSFGFLFIFHKVEQPYFLVNLELVTSVDEDHYNSFSDFFKSIQHNLNAFSFQIPKQGHLSFSYSQLVLVISEDPRFFSKHSPNSFEGQISWHRLQPLL